MSKVPVAPAIAQQPKKPSTGSSKVGAVLSILSLISSAIASALIHSKYKPDEPITTTSQKAGVVVASGTWHVLATIFSIPLIVGGVVLGLLAIAFTLLRLKKVKAGGLVFSVVWIVLAVWAIRIAVAALETTKAH